jgi:hypothetical protein
VVRAVDLTRRKDVGARAELRRRLRSDPVFFARAALAAEPWGRQRDVLEAVARSRRVAVAGGQGVGKDHVAACAILWFLYTRPGSLVLSTAPTARQVRRLLWGEVRRLWGRSRVALGGTLRQTELVLAPGWYALGFSTDDPDRFQGFHAASMLVVVDEAAGVDDAIFEAADAVLTGSEARLLLIGNPTRTSGRFHAAFSDASFESLRVRCTEHPNVVEGRELIPGAVSREWVEWAAKTYGEDSAFYAARVLAEFPGEPTDALLRRQWIEAAFERERGLEGERSAGVDVARFGRDSTVIVACEGGTVTEILSARGRDLVATADEVAGLVERLAVPPSRVFVDDTGLGGGVTDVLRSRGLAVRGVQFGSAASRPERFVNRSAEIFWNLRRLLETGAAALGRVAASRDGEVLREQMERLRVAYADSGKIAVSGEPGPKAAPSTSPDHADALALAMAPVKPPWEAPEPGALAGALAGVWLGA